MNPDLTVIELRQYTQRGGRRDELITLFERELIEPQQAAGLYVVGVFRDLEDPDRFAWIRGFADMAARKAALETFYGGPVWKGHRDAANATILDSDNVLLLSPLPQSDGLLRPTRKRISDVVRVAMHALGAVDPLAFADFFERSIQPSIEAAGASVLARLITETTPITSDSRCGSTSRCSFGWRASTVPSPNVGLRSAWPEPAAGEMLRPKRFCPLSCGSPRS